MRIAPATWLAAWAVGTAWLLIYVLTHYGQHQLGADRKVMQVIQGASVVAGLILFPLLRKWFRAWLTKPHD